MMERCSKSILVLSLVFSLSAGVPELRSQTYRASRTVEPINEEGLRQLIHERAGRILLLNVWATWCKPCVEEFPGLIRLQQTYRDSLVDVIAISVDYPDEVASKILPFLDSLGVSFPVFVADIPKPEDLITTLNPAWSGAVPATFVFDRHGQRRAFLLGEKSYEIFKREVERALQGTIN
jgi:thiol-disulfide isomerase/thioredoxin